MKKLKILSINIMLLGVLGVMVFIFLETSGILSGDDKLLYLRRKGAELHEFRASPKDTFKPPILPDISGMTVDAILKKRPALQEGHASVEEMVNVLELTKFLEKGGEDLFRRAQEASTPKAIVLSQGVYDLHALTKTINNSNYLEEKNGAYYVRLPIVVKKGAALIISGSADNKQIVRLSTAAGSFIAMAGELFITDADISAWDEKEARLSPYQGKESFRPFVTIWSGGESWFGRSNFWNLGYGGSKSYGISFSTDKRMLKKDSSLSPPTGWIIECYFNGLHYGFYSYEAEGVAIIRSVYDNNIIYGIDPHDRSERLIIAYNETLNTHKKHGTIVSREVNDSWIFNNYSHHNHGSGFMLDRSSIRNTVAYNVSEYNGSDGLTLFESQENYIYGNTLRHNQKVGFRSRNSWNVRSAKNKIYLNTIGVQSYASSIDGDDTRDFELDPYTKRASIYLEDDIIFFNHMSEFKMIDNDVIWISGLQTFFTGEADFKGDISTFSRFLPGIVGRRHKGVEIRKVKDRPFR